MSGILSATSPLVQARNTTLYYYRIPDILPTVKDLLSNKEILESAMHPIARAVCIVSLLNFSRVNEILSLTVADILTPDRAICQGSKRGRAYLILLPGISQQLLDNCIVDPSTLLFPITYLKCYRSYVRAGIRLDRGVSSNKARCHIGRYSVKDLNTGGVPESVLSDLLHHKSASSLIYYLNK